VDDDVVQQGANLLLTFTNIRNEVGAGLDIFDRATTTLVDMAAALGTEVPANAVQLGKALNDPIRGLTALTRVGVTFTEQQRDQVRAMVEAGDVASAQALILDELAKEFGGSAEAQASAMDRIRVAGGNLSEQVGGTLLPVIERLAPVVEGAVDVFSSAPPALQTVIVLLGGIAAAAGPVGRTIEGIRSITSLLPRAATAAANAAATQAAAVNQAQQQAANSAASVSNLYAGGAANAGRFAGVTRQLPSVMGAAGVAIGGATVALGLWNQRLSEGEEAAAEFGSGVRDRLAGKETFDSFVAGLESAAQGITDLETARANSRSPLDADYRRDLEAGADELGRVRDEFQRLVPVIEEYARVQGTDLDTATRAVLGNTTAVTDALENGYTPAQAAAVAATNERTEAEERANLVADATVDAYERQQEAAADYAESLERAVGALRDYYGLQSSGVEAGLAFRDALANIADKRAEVEAGELSGQERLDQFTELLLRGRDAALDNAEALLRNGSTAQEAADATNALVEQMFAAADQAGLTADEVAFLREQLGLLPDQVDVAFDTNVDDAIGDAQRLEEALERLQNQPWTIDVSLFRPALAGARADGGFVEANRDYLVGERRAEVFRSPVSGTIDPVVPRGSSGPGVIIGEVNIVSTDPRESVRQLQDRLAVAGQGSAR
jgi:polyhydroxyalkanoate synthesis regulator phasin